jgi:hypothetical protein
VNQNTQGAACSKIPGKSNIHAINQSNHSTSTSSTNLRFLKTTDKNSLTHLLAGFGDYNPKAV